jgi:hypothetical protein
MGGRGCRGDSRYSIRCRSARGTRNGLRHHDDHAADTRCMRINCPKPGVDPAPAAPTPPAEWHAAVYSDVATCEGLSFP